MDDSWTRGVHAFDVVGTGAGLAGRVGTGPWVIVTNHHTHEDPRFVSTWFTWPDRDDMEEHQLVITPGARFPYGFDIGPP